MPARIPPQFFNLLKATPLAQASLNRIARGSTPSRNDLGKPSYRLCAGSLVYSLFFSLLWNGSLRKIIFAEKNVAGSPANPRHNNPMQSMNYGNMHRAKAVQKGLLETQISEDQKIIGGG